jgi:molybdenum cofactor biosynthesis enzyme MoaA
MVDMGVSNARENHTCFMCERALAAAEEAAFLQLTAEKADSLPTVLREREGKLRAAKEEAAALQRAQPAWQEVQQLQEEDVPEAEDASRGCVCAAACAAPPRGLTVSMV